MKFSDIDFNALGSMMNMLSEDEKERLNGMAEQMMEQMGRPQEADESSEELTFQDALHLSDAQLDVLAPASLNALEAAFDLESFYDGDVDADYSGSALFYVKALLGMLRHSLYPVLKNVLGKDMVPVNMTQLKDYMLSQEDISRLVSEGFGSMAGWQRLAAVVNAGQAALLRAEFDTVSFGELEGLKQLLFAENGLFLPGELK